MTDNRINRAKVNQWLGLWWQITIEDTRGPLFDSSARLQFFSLVALLIFVLPPEGYFLWREELTNAWRAILAFLYALPLYAIVNSVVAAFKATKEQRRLGHWAGNRFVFHERRHLMTAVVTDKENGKLLPFQVTGLPKNASVDLIVEIEKGFDDRNTRVQFISRLDHPITWDQYEHHNMLAIVPDDEIFYVTTQKQTPSNASTIKVFLMSWYT